jgi:hypothetical protein
MKHDNDDEWTADSLCEWAYRGAFVLFILICAACVVLWSM